MSRVLVLMGVLALASAVTPFALADQPTKEALSLPTDPFEVDGFCAFPVEVQVLKNSEVLTTYGDGRMHVAGQLVAQLTNVEDRTRSIVVNASGPVRSNPDGSFTGTGRGLFFVPASLSPTGQPFIAWTSGPAVTVLDSDGIFQPVDLPSHVIDLGTVLASGS